MDWDVGETRVTGTERTVALPGTVRRHQQCGDLLVLVLNPGNQGARDPDVTLSSPTANLVAVTGTGDLAWTVDPVALDDRQGDRHRSVVESGERLVTRSREGSHFLVDPATGELLEWWSPREYGIGGKIVEFDDPVGGVVALEDCTVLRTGTRQSVHLWGFDADGTERWRRLNDVWNWVVVERDGACWVWDEPNMGRVISFRVDVETGALVEAESNSSDAQQTLDFDAIDGKYVHPWLSSCTLFDEDGRKLWSESFDASVADAELREDGLTRIYTEDGSEHLVGPDGERR